MLAESGVPGASGAPWVSRKWSSRVAPLALLGIPSAALWSAYTLTLR